MAELPFSDEPESIDELEPVSTPAPRATTIKRGVIVGVSITVLLGLAGFILFGTRSVHNRGHHGATRPVEAAPRPANVSDPLRHVQTDYGALLAKAPAASPSAPPVLQTAPDTQSASPQAQQAPAAPRPAKPKKDEGMLVLEGKRATAQRQPTRVAALPDSAEREQQPASAPPDANGTGNRNRAFLAQATGLRETQVQDTLHTPESPYMVLAGDIIPATLVTGIQSDLPGELLARARVDLRDSVTGETLLVPQGTIFIGTYNNELVYGQDRVLIVWHRLRLPNGKTIQLQGMPGIDVSGYAGLKDKVNHHLWPLFRAVLLSSVLSIGTRVPFGSPDGFLPNLSQQYAEDFSRGANQAGQQIVRRELTRSPTITIRPGMNFNIFVLKDLVLEPYTGAIATRR